MSLGAGTLGTSTLGISQIDAPTGVTGSGSPQADDAIGSGTGLRLIVGSGSPQADDAIGSGTGTSIGAIAPEVVRFSLSICRKITFNLNITKKLSIKVER